MSPRKRKDVNTTRLKVNIYEDDSDVETERKDKLFRIKDVPWRWPQKVTVALLFTILAYVIYFSQKVTLQTAYQQVNREQYGLVCKDLGANFEEAKILFSFVVLVNRLTSDQNLYSTLNVVRQNLKSGDSVIISFERSPKLRRLQEVIKYSFTDILKDHVVTVCDAQYYHDVWRDLWKQNLVAEDFIILDELAQLDKNWRDWIQATRLIHPTSVLSLQDVLAPERVAFQDLHHQIQVDDVPCYAALSPGPHVWKSFLRWFDSEPGEYLRAPGQRFPQDREDFWRLNSIGPHASWTKPFAQFLARHQISVVHALPPLAKSNHELAPKEIFI